MTTLSPSQTRDIIRMYRTAVKYANHYMAAICQKALDLTYQHTLIPLSFTERSMIVRMTREDAMQKCLTIIQMAAPKLICVERGVELRNATPEECALAKLAENGIIEADGYRCMVQ
jgi:hypothetical protein